MTFENFEELIQYAKEEARKKAMIKTKLFSSTGSLYMIYKNELEKIYSDMKKDIESGEIVVLNGPVRKKQK